MMSSLGPRSASVAVAWCIGLTAARLPAQQSGSSQLTIDRIFASNDFRGETVRQSNWTSDGRGYKGHEGQRQYGPAQIG